MNVDSYSDIPVLVTGGCGFIGSHLTEQLVKLGARVTIIDDFSAGTLDNIANVKQNVNLIQATITDQDACLYACTGQKIIFHLAALVSVPLSWENPLLCHQINITGTYNMLEAARLCGASRFVFSSSSAVYGDYSLPVSEDIGCRPQSPYGYSKYVAEIICQQYTQLYGLETVRLRYFNVWGQRQDPSGSYAPVIAKFRDQMEKNLPITIYGNGTQTRDFVHVTSVTSANVLLGLTPLATTETFNIASGTSISLLELIEQLKKEYPEYDREIAFINARPFDLNHSQADCSKYLNLLAKQGQVQ